MIGWFPTPYPDELLYSVCARYQEQVDYPSLHALAKELFGDFNISPIIDLPCCLERLISALPAGHYLTVDRLIDNHTLLPFYSSFLPADRVDCIRKEMGHSNCRIVHKLAGIYASSVRTPYWLRFCPICVKEDRDKIDFTYWHRSHQLPGIDVCPDHAVFLENSQARARDLRVRDGYIAAEQAVANSLPRPITPSNPAHVTQLSISRSAKWLLRARGFLSDLAELLSYASLRTRACGDVW